MGGLGWVLAAVAAVAALGIWSWALGRRCPACGDRLRQVGLLHETYRGFSDLVQCGGCGGRFRRRGATIRPGWGDEEVGGERSGGV
ncbi:MAG: hypothetical protein C0501_26830 [Isosphaera sp.]|nr:hypothetical protein [Isosphaera sp.]